MIKTIIVYALFILGIPNLLGLLVGTPFGFILAAIVGRLSRHANSTAPLSIAMGLSMGLGCGIVGVAAVWLFGQSASIAFPIISGLWSLFYYYSRSTIGFEALSLILGIWGMWVVFWVL